MAYGLIDSVAPWTRQPKGPVQLAKRYSGALFSAIASPLVLPLQRSGTIARMESVDGYSTTPRGNAWAVTSAATNHLNIKDASGVTTGISIPAGGSWTVLIHAKINSIPAGNPGFFRTDSAASGGTFFIVDGSGNSPWVRVNGSNVLRPSSGEAIAVGQDTVFVCSMKSGERVDVAWDGKVRHSATHAVAQTSDLVCFFGWQSSTTETVIGDYYSITWLPWATSPAETGALSSPAGYYANVFDPLNDDVFYSIGGATDYPVTATDALTLADSASQSFTATGVAADAMTLADSASNVAALSATASAALTLADSASNVAALAATATDALTLADTLNATASGDYTGIGSDALTLADSASNVAALGATGSDALTLADAASNAAALGAAASDALTLADTLNASASGDYVVVATDALSLSDSVVAAYAAICIATDALTLADATSAAMAGEYAATATDALTLADAASNAAALGVSISEALTLAALVSAMTAGDLTIDMPRTRRLGGSVASRNYRLGGPVAGRRQRLGGPITKE